MEYHKPVLLNESVEGLAIQPDGIYVDLTYGGGGHSKEILKRLERGRLIAFDQDEDANANKVDDERLTLVNQNFSYLKNFLKLYNALPVDGILADLGISSHQIDEAERGFSIRFDAELDLRMNQKSSLTAKEIINNYQEADLKRMFFEFGDVENAYKLSLLIAEKRKESPINTTFQFLNAIERCAPRGKENKYFAKVFQALRIEVNNELEALKEMLVQALDVLKPSGRLVVISYHSLEDRLVKNFIKSGNFKGIIEQDFYGNNLSPFKMISRKAIVPSEQEIDINKRSRSAKLRIAEKK
ncbi:MAG: 16S rRNA (cytosine(1402)-N(4))-methyltransferase RsmH [Bacteroidetes bacterium]|nr:16S rRNA (cytosine(1402)-N(4))-methyltransferase RsmH [Bacteroidota bacterium]